MALREFYARSEDDPNYQSDILEVSDEIECLIYQIKNTLMSNRGDVLGEVRFGGNLQTLLFDIDSDPNGVLAYLNDQIQNFSEMARAYKVTLDYKVVQDTMYRDAGIIDVLIDGKSYFGMVL